MKITLGISAIPRYKKPVVAIGMFDGMHVGHAAILKECARTARKIGGTSVVLTFRPHPQKEERIYSLDHRLAIMAGLGIQACMFIRFNKAFARVSARDFVRRVIAAKIGAAYVMVGANFMFGRGLAGDAALLRALGAEYGYRTKIFPIMTRAGSPVSSTRIRGSIARGALAEAERLLGRKVSLMGKVVRGRAVGRTLGFPTANIKPQHEVLPPDGIYAVHLNSGGRRYAGICYKGTRPTFGGGGAPSIEVYLFDFSGDLYGKTVEVRFFRRLRGQKKFASVEELRAAIKKDVSAAKKILRRSS